MHPSQAFHWCMLKMFNIRKCTSYAFCAQKALGMSIAHVCGIGFLRFWANRKETFALRKRIVPDRIFKRSKIRGLRSNTQTSENRISPLNLDTFYVLKSIDVFLFHLRYPAFKKIPFRYKIYVNKRVCTNVLFVQAACANVRYTHAFAPVDCKVAKIQNEQKHAQNYKKSRRRNEENALKNRLRKKYARTHRKASTYNTKVIFFILGLTNTFNPNPKNLILISFNFIFFRLRVKSHWIADQRRTAWIECKRITTHETNKSNNNSNNGSSQNAYMRANVWQIWIARRHKKVNCFTNRFERICNLVFCN